MAHEKLGKLDLDLLKLMVEEPKVGVREYARRLNVARGTVQSRIDRFARNGVITSYQPQVDPAALGYSILAFIHVRVAQATLDVACDALAAIPEVLEVNSVAGESDMLCKAVALDHTDFERVVQEIISSEGVIRAKTELVLSRRIAPRIVPLLEKKRSQVE